MMLHAPFALLATAALASAAAAQVPSSLLNEGDPLPGAPAGHVVQSLNNTGVNQVGGWSVTVNTSDGVTTLSHVYGDPAASGTASILITEATYGPLVQTSFESFFGMDDGGAVAYSATGTGGAAGGFDSVWHDTTPLAVEGDPSPVSGMFWRFASRPGITANGIPYFVGGLTNTVGGSTMNYGLFAGNPAAPVIVGGTSLGGLPFALSTSNTVSFDVRYSALGSHYIAEVQMASGSTADDNAVVIDGTGLVLGGGLVREGDPVPAAIGGIGGENWDNFDYTGHTEAGDWFFTGDTDGSTATDEIIVRNGVVWHREGDVIGGFPISSSITAAYMNEAGDLAFIWDADTGGGPVDALFLNETLIAAEGDLVDLDGDGVVEPNSVLANFTGISALTLGADGAMYVTADVDVNGTSSTTDDIEAVLCFRVASAPPVTYCTAGTSQIGCVPSIGSTGTPSLSNAGPFSITTTGVEGTQNGIVFYGISGRNAASWGIGGSSYLCVKSPTQRTPLQSSGGTSGVCDGSFDLDWNGYVAANPLKAIHQALSVGTVVDAQTWYRDPGAAKNTSLSDGLEFTVSP